MDFLVILISSTVNAAAEEEAGRRIEGCQFTELLATSCRLSPMFGDIHCCTSDIDDGKKNAIV